MNQGEKKRRLAAEQIAGGDERGKEWDNIS